MTALRRRKGFVMLLVLMVLAMIGVMTGVMAFTSRSLLADANRQRADLAGQNLRASALAWTAIHRSEMKPNKVISLEAASLGVSEGELTVTLQDDGRVQVATAFEQGRMKIHKAAVFRLTGQ
jgi:flagellar basal body-associated protein FliL